MLINSNAMNVFNLFLRLQFVRDLHRNSEIKTWATSILKKLGFPYVHEEE